MYGDTVDLVVRARRSALPSVMGSQTIGLQVTSRFGVVASRRTPGLQLPPEPEPEPDNTHSQSHRGAAHTVEHASHTTRLRATGSSALPTAVSATHSSFTTYTASSGQQSHHLQQHVKQQTDSKLKCCMHRSAQTQPSDGGRSSTTTMQQQQQHQPHSNDKQQAAVFPEQVKREKERYLSSC